MSPTICPKTFDNTPTLGGSLLDYHKPRPYCYRLWRQKDGLCPVSPTVCPITFDDTPTLGGSLLAYDKPDPCCYRLRRQKDGLCPVSQTLCPKPFDNTPTLGGSLLAYHKPHPYRYRLRRQTYSLIRLNLGTMQALLYIQPMLLRILLGHPTVKHDYSFAEQLLAQKHFDPHLSVPLDTTHASAWPPQR